eukprot:IDg8404t1
MRGDSCNSVLTVTLWRRGGVSATHNCQRVKHDPLTHRCVPSSPPAPRRLPAALAASSSYRSTAATGYPAPRATRPPPACRAFARPALRCPPRRSPSARARHVSSAYRAFCAHCAFRAFSRPARWQCVRHAQTSSRAKARSA